MIPLCVLVARHCRKMALFRPLVRTRNAFPSAPERNWTVFDKYFPTKVLPLSFEIKISLQRYSERARALKAPPEEERNEGRDRVSYFSRPISLERADAGR